MDVIHVVPLDAFLGEDVGEGDVTTELLIPSDARCAAELVVKEPGVVCGLEWAELVFRALDDGIEFETLAAEGDPVGAGTRVARVFGAARAVLTGERLALNIIGRMSGIATLTRRYVDAIEGTAAEILDTRKTTPGFRVFEKAAVQCGGGRNHRFGLYDGILIKDNHIALAGSIKQAVACTRASGMPVQVEVESLDGLREALDACADSILLDNMSPSELAEAVRVTAGRAKLEASGGITLDTIRAVAETGVDFISIGALTHSARSLDVSLEVL